MYSRARFTHTHAHTHARTYCVAHAGGVLTCAKANKATTSNPWSKRKRRSWHVTLRSPPPHSDTFALDLFLRGNSLTCTLVHQSMSSLIHSFPSLPVTTENKGTHRPPSGKTEVLARQARRCTPEARFAQCKIWRRTGARVRKCDDRHQRRC